MAKGNLFLGFARGSVGDAVFYRANGQQISRARNRSPKNARTPLQLLQRVVLKTVSTAYSMLRPLADHSFQGRAEGNDNQSEFSRLNIGMLREQLAEEINSGDAELIVTSGKTNYSAKTETLPEINPYILSSGTLPSLQVSFTSGLFSLALPSMETAVTAPTYADVVAALGLAQGDQLTFVVLSTNDSDSVGGNSQFTSMQYARVLLEPTSGDMAAAFLSGSSVNEPNERNEGDVSLTFVAATTSTPAYLQFSVPFIATAAGAVNSAAAATVISSRLSGGVWQRSTQHLVVRPDDTATTGHLAFDAHQHYLGDAVWSFMSTEQSSLYLNASRSFTRGA